jgi:hypothetical protein
MKSIVKVNGHAIAHGKVDSTSNKKWILLISQGLHIHSKHAFITYCKKRIHEFIFIPDFETSQPHIVPP